MMPIPNAPTSQRSRRLAALHSKRASSSLAPKGGKPLPSPSVPMPPNSSYSKMQADTLQSPPRHRNGTIVSSPRGRPPVVSPHPPLSPNRSWERPEKEPFRLVPRYAPLPPHPSDRSVLSDAGHAQYEPRRRLGSSRGDDRSVHSDSMMMLSPRISDDIDEVPDDDMAAEPPRDSSYSHFYSERRSRPGDPRKQSVTDWAPSSLGSNVLIPRRTNSHDDDVSSLGGVEDHCGSVQRITLAVKNRSARPSGLTLEEKALWEAIQSAVRDARGGERRVIVHDRSDQSVDSVDSWESKYNEAIEHAECQQKESDKSLRAIQRVLADATTDRDNARAELKKLKATIKSMEAVDPEEITKLKEELKSKSDKLTALEQELNTTKVNVDSDDSSKLLNEIEESKNIITRLTSEKEELQTEVSAKEQQISELKLQITSKSGTDAAVGQEPSSTDGQDPISRELKEKTSALENAKMIIASLEKSSGELAADLRAKMKAKDEELTRLRTEMLEKQKTIDSLAIELRDAQRSQARLQVAISTEERSKRLALSSRLETNMAEVRAAAVILEATQDPASVERIESLLSDSVEALKASIDTIDDDMSTDADSVGSFATDPSSAPPRARRAADTTKLKKDVEEKTAAVKRLEEDLLNQKAETERFKLEVENVERRRDAEVQTLYAEIQKLREQCSTNMEVLTRKERELAVLRDSLKVDDGVGYISDDATDADDENDEPLPPASALDSGVVYGPTQAEALATLLAHGGSSFDIGRRSFDNESVAPSSEIEKLSRELAKTRTDYDKVARSLKTEKESLANAKMIISSLEKANKSMMEDLRARLHDSNTAIASLLEKSMESEKANAKLRAELELLRREREEEMADYQTSFFPRSELNRLSPLEEKKDDRHGMPTELID